MPFNKRQELWLEAGYTEFAKYGLESMNVDRLAGLVGKSRSSFYHLFGNLQQFRSDLSEYHRSQTQKFMEAQALARSFYPDLCQVLVRYKDYTFFQVQLYLNRERCEECRMLYDELTPRSEVITSKLWAEMVGLDSVAREKSLALFRIIREAIFSRLKYDSFSEEYMLKAVKTYNDSIKFLVPEDHQ